MATFSMNLLRSRPRPDGKMQIAFHVSNNATKDVIRSGVYISDFEWDAKNKIVIGNNVRQHNRSLDIFKGDIQTVINNLKIQGNLKTVTAKEIKQMVENGSFDSVQNDNNDLMITSEVFTKTSEQSRISGKNACFFDFARDVISRIIKKRTQQNYDGTCKKIRGFYEFENPKGNPEQLTFNQIDLGFVKRFDSWMEKDGLKINSRSVNLRNLRKLYNDAIDENLASSEIYPFRKFTIKTEETKHRNVEVMELIKLRDFECEPHQKQYIDMFFLGFYLIGINLIDLCGLTKIEKNGRIEYQREKTGRWYYIKVEPEAKALIEKYRGENYLIDLMERYTDHASYLGRLNSNLKEIGTLEKVEKNGAKQRKEKEDAPFSYISWYYARHTWATIAAELDISDDIIALALGHGKKTVTDIYIKRNLKKVDDANRKVIDYVNNYNPEEDIGEKHAEKNVETADEIKSLTSADLLKNIEELVAKLDNPESLTPHDVEGLKILNWMYEKEKGKYAIKPQKHTLMQRKRTLKPKIKS